MLAVALLALAAGAASGAPLYRLQLHLAPDANVRPRPLLLTVGGPVYCMQLQSLARHLDASLACTDYGPNRDEGIGGRTLRQEDWGDPAYDAGVAKIPAELRARGVRISQLVVVGVSYSGFANAELVASHPELRPAALLVIDSYLDLAARFAALPSNHETRREILRAVGGTPAQLPQAYAARSPSDHLAGLARAIRSGMRFVDVWSVGPSEVREFRGATCSLDANARWLAALAETLGRPITGYVTQMAHAHALWDRGRGTLQLAGIGSGAPPLPAHPVVFRPGASPPRNSFCIWHAAH